MPTDRRYTGQRAEVTLGVYDYGARMYDVSLGRFISADSIVPEPGRPQDWNRYAYVRNGPVTYIDHDGHFPVPFLLIAVLAGILFIPTDTPRAEAYATPSSLAPEPTSFNISPLAPPSVASPGPGGVGKSFSIKLPPVDVGTWRIEELKYEFSVNTGAPKRLSTVTDSSVMFGKAEVSYDGDIKVIGMQSSSTSAQMDCQSYAKIGVSPLAWDYVGGVYSVGSIVNVNGRELDQSLTVKGGIRPAKMATIVVIVAVGWAGYNLLPYLKAPPVTVPNTGSDPNPPIAQ